MKNLAIIFILIIFNSLSLFSYSIEQAMRDSYVEIEKYKKEVRNNNDDEMYEYKVECKTIEIVMSKYLENNYSTADMSTAIEYAYKEYDKLLNKYYFLYRDAVSEETAKALQKEQRSWLKVRDAYSEYLDNTIAHLYTTGFAGSETVIELQNEKLEFLKERVDILFTYYYNTTF